MTPSTRPTRQGTWAMASIMSPRPGATPAAYPGGLPEPSAPCTIGDGCVVTEYSPDGKWWWDGERWLPVDRPNQYHGANRGPLGRRAFVGLAVIGVLLLALIAAVAVRSC